MRLRGPINTGPPPPPEAGRAMTVRILYFVPADASLRALIEEERPEGYEILYLEGDDEAELRAKLAEAEVVMVGARRLESWHIEAAPKLRLVLHNGVGRTEETTAELQSPMRTSTDV